MCGEFERVVEVPALKDERQPGEVVEHVLEPERLLPNVAVDRQLAEPQPERLELRRSDERQLVAARLCASGHHGAKREARVSSWISASTCIGHRARTGEQSIDIGADGTAGAIIELTLSEPLKGPDGMRFGDDGVLYLAENAAGRVDAVTIDGDTATIAPLPGEAYDFPAAVTKVGDTLWVLESKLGLLGKEEDPGTFYIHPVSLQ